MARRRVDLPTEDGTLDLYVCQPDRGEGPWPPVVVYMDAFGVRSDLESMAERLAANGYLVALPNLYHRSGAFPPFDLSKAVGDGPERPRVKQMIASINGDTVMRDTAAVLRWIEGEAASRTGAVGVVGYCMGGGYALRAAGVFPEQVAVAASFHAGSLATDRPDSPHLLADRIRAKVYIGVAGIDPSFSDDQRARLERALTDAGVDYTLEVYPGARHGFAVTGHPVYDQAASERHWDRLLALLRNLGSDPV